MKFHLILFSCLLLSSCSILNISNLSFFDQIREGQKKEPQKITSKSFYGYDRNNLLVLSCEKSGKPVKLKIDKNTRIKVDINDYKFKSVKLYFDGVTLKGDTLVGYESRISKIPHKITIFSITKVQVIAEFAKYEK